MISRSLSASVKGSALVEGDGADYNHVGLLMNTAATFLGLCEVAPTVFELVEVLFPLPEGEGVFEDVNDLFLPRRVQAATAQHVLHVHNDHADQPLIA